MIHVVAGFIICAAVVLNLIDIGDTKPVIMKQEYMHYAVLLLLCSLFDVISHALKESIVRAQPLNQEKFNYRISLAQLGTGIVMTPFVLQVSKEYEDYSGNTAIADPKNMPLWEFMAAYFSEGLSCLFQVENKLGRCDYSFVYLLGYVFSLFVL